MCGRFALYKDIYAIMQVLNIPSRPPDKEYHLRYNITPSETIITIFQNRTTRELCIGLSSWGFIPNAMVRRMSQSKIKPSVFINARMETVSRKPSFANAFSNYRCLIPASGFYEWDSAKNGYFFSPAESDFMLLASIYEITHLPPQKNHHKGSLIITTEAREPVTQIHHRMPLIIDPKDVDAWLDITTDDAILQAIMKRSLSIPLQIERMDPIQRQKTSELHNAKTAELGLA